MQTNRSILAIDPAWTAGEPSGVALVVEKSDSWRSIAVAPSYQSFMQIADGVPVNWHQNGPFAVENPDPASLLQAAQIMAPASEICLVSVDMPVATVTFNRRRLADQLISQEFGGFGCSTHSPTEQRPGRIGRIFSEGFASLGYPVATTATAVGELGHILEVYPHTALLRLLHLHYRFPYKVSRRSRYWPGVPAATCRINLLQSFREILDGLERYISGIEIPIPNDDNQLSFSKMKRFEDALDALVCAWVGTCYLDGAAKPYGDETAAIWVPDEVI